MTSSARRALNILDIVNASPEPLGVTAIAEAADTLPGTAFRSLDALERCGFIARYRASTQYRLGPTAQRLKHTLYAQFPLRSIALPFLRRLAYASGDTITLTVPVGWYALRLAVVTGNSPVRSASTPGIIGPLDADYSGLAILSTFDAPTLARFEAEAKPVHDGPALRDALGEISTRGFAVSAEDDDVIGGSVAFPVRHAGRAIAAIAVEGPVAGRDGPSEPESFAEWQAIVSELEANIGAITPFPACPFEHLDPAAVTRLLALPAAGA